MFKILNIVLALLLFGNTAYGSLEKDQTYILGSFTGLNDHINPLLTPSDKANEAKNVRYNNKYGALGKREPLLTLWDAGSAAITGLHKNYKSDGTSKTIIGSGTVLAIGSTTDTTTTTINTGVSDGKRWQFVTYKDIAIGANGSNQPIKYDGHTQTTANTDGSRTAGELCAELGAPFAEQNTGSNLTASRWYQYKVMFLVSGVTYYSNAKSNPLLTGTTVRDISLSNIPIGPTGTTARYIYRTIGNTSQAACEADATYKLVATDAGNTATTYDDTMTDATWAGQTAWSTSAKFDCTPPVLKYIYIHKERLFGAGNSTYSSYLFFSDDGNPDFFLPTAFENIRADDGDSITFIKGLLGQLVIGKTNSIQKYYTDGSSTTDWYASDVFSTNGCPAPYSPAVTPMGIFYLGRHGIWRFDGTNVTLISDAVTPDIEDINQTNVENCVGFYYNNEYSLAYNSISGGLTNNDKVLIYNLIRDSYTIDTKNINCFASLSSGTDLGQLISGSSLADGYVVAHSSTIPFIYNRLKSEIDAGTKDDVNSFGEEINPNFSISWDCTIATWLTELQAKNGSITTIASIATYLPTAIIARPDTSGTWTSPVFQINAAALDKLYWNETLGAYGDVTWQIRLDSDTDMTGISWQTAVSNPNGSDVSGITANTYIQLRANFSTTDINYTPEVYQDNGYFFKLIYSKLGSNNETSVLSLHKTGWLDFGKPANKKLITKIKVYYTGTSGTLSVGIKGDDGDIDRSWDIDLSVAPDFSTTDSYTGKGDLKVYTYYPGQNTTTAPSLVSRLFQISLTENGLIGWTIYRLSITYDAEENYD